MALAYTAPTWENGGGVGISASQLQALSDCMEGLVQGSDKAITNIAISGQTITLTFADGSQEAGTASGLKGISSIAKTGTSGNVDTYTITYTDGSTSTFTVTNGADGSFYIVTAGIKSTDDPYGNIEYYIGGDFYKNGVLYNQSAFYKVTLVDETEYPPSPYLIDGSSGTFTNGHYSTGSIGGIPSGATITAQIFTDSTMTTLLGEVKVLIGLRGSEGEQGQQGPAGADGADGVSPEVTITTITGGHRVNITDATHPQGQDFDVMDGATQDISGKADKVSNATNGNFAGLDSNGNLTDSGKKASDFLPSNTPIPSITNCYQTTDTEETALANADYVPFYDISASAKRKISWSNIKSVLKTYFDTLYSKVVANPSGTATGTLTKLGIGSDIYEIQGGGGSSTLAGLSDVNITNLAEGQVLLYNGSKWENKYISSVLVPWSSGTDEQISAMIDAYYMGYITLDNVKSVWNVGDVREVDISAITASGGSGATAWSVGESHRAQTIQLQIIDFDHDVLTSPINNKTKALITVNTKDCLRDASVTDTSGSSNTENGYINSTATSSTGWANCARRAWCNNAFYNALPIYIKDLVKSVTKSTNNGSNVLTATQDYVFLLSEVEMVGTAVYTLQGEGSQYAWFSAATANRYKNPKWNDSSSFTSSWWGRSALTQYPGNYGEIIYNGTYGGETAEKPRGIAPTFAI